MVLCSYLSTLFIEPNIIHAVFPSLRIPDQRRAFDTTVNLHCHTIITQNLEAKAGVPLILHSGAFAKGTMKCNHHYKFIQKKLYCSKIPLSSMSSSLTLPKYWQLWSFSWLHSFIFSSMQQGWNHMLGSFSRFAYFDPSYTCDVHLNCLLVFRWQEACICFVIVELFFFVVLGD